MAEQDALLGKNLFAREPNECCRMRKVEPLSKALHGYSAWVTGIRRVEAPTRANAPLISLDEAFGLVKINPLAAWTDDDMQDYIDANGILVNPLVFEGYPSIGCAPCTAKPIEGADPRSGRWAGQSKTECGLHASDEPRCRADGARQRRPARRGQHARGRRSAFAATRPGLDVRVAFCEQNSPNLRDVLATGTPDAVVTPLLLADAYHARVDIPAMIADSGAARQADVLGEDRPTGARYCASGSHEAGVSSAATPASACSSPQWVRLDSAANTRTAAVAHRARVGHALDRRCDRVRHRPAPVAARTRHELLRERGARRWWSRPGSSRTAGSPTASRISLPRNAFRWQSRWAHIGWWPRRCSTASTGLAPNRARRCLGRRRQLLLRATQEAACCPRCAGTRVART